MIKLLIFDFDGTLVDSREIIYEIIKNEIKPYGVNLDNEYKKDMGLYRLRDEINKMNLGSELAKLLPRINEKIAERSSEFKFQKGFDSLKNIKIQMCILSNNSEKTIKLFFKNKKIKLFKKVIGEGKFKDKTEAIMKIMKKSKLKPQEVIFVGDRMSDVVAGKKAGIISVAIYNDLSWGTKKEILGAKPDFVIHDLKELERIIERLNSS